MTKHSTESSPKNRNDIITNLITSSENNDFSYLWRKIIKHYALNSKTLKDSEFEDQRLNIACHSQMDILHTLFASSSYILPNIMFQMCRENHTDFICEDLISYYLVQLVKVAEKVNNGKKVYFIRRVSFRCKKDDSHTIMIILSPYDNTISFVDPVSSKVSENDDDFFKTLHTIYRCLDGNVINDYKIVCPQLYSSYDIQSMLTVNEQRNGACAIISILIIHAMIYTQSTSLDAINNIGSLIKKKSFEKYKFIDGYTIFLNTIIEEHIDANRNNWIFLDEDTFQTFNNEKEYLGLLNKLRSENKISWIQHRFLSLNYINTSLKGYSKLTRKSKK